MNQAFTPSKLLIGIVAVAALLGGCKKNEVVTTTPTADTSVSTPATTTATTPATTGSMAGTTTPSTSDTTGSSGMTGSTGAGTSTPSSTAVTGTSGNMPGMSKDPANDASKPAVRNNSGQTQGTTGSSLPTSDGSR